MGKARVCVGNMAFLVRQNRSIIQPSSRQAMILVNTLAINNIYWYVKMLIICKNRAIHLLLKS